MSENHFYEPISRNLMKTYQERANTLISQGNQLQQAGNLDQAVDAYRKAIELVPAYGMFHLVLADILFKLKRYTEAAESYRATVEFTPEHDQAWAGLGQCQLLLGDFAGAQESLEQALELNPQEGRAHYYLAMLNARNKDHKTALRHLKSALQQLPKWEAHAQEDPLLKQYFEDPSLRAKLMDKKWWQFWRREQPGQDK